MLQSRSPKLNDKTCKLTKRVKLDIFFNFNVKSELLYGSELRKKKIRGIYLIFNIPILFYLFPI